jgi:3-carboxy-cis,cis-muconate cycloisomerase
MAESVTLALAKHLGKQDAHHLVETLCHTALDQKRPLLQLLEADSRISCYFTSTELHTLLDPSRATGSADHFVRQVLTRYQEQRHDASLSD